MSSTRPIVLCIRDGWGENPNADHAAFNAITLARKPVDDALRANWPMTLIQTSGVDVGLPPGTMGNSEVGHQNIGAGRVVEQELLRINRAIREGQFATNTALLDAISHARSTGGSIHLLGLLSDGYVHSDIEHLFALIDLVASRNLDANRIFVHAITDGRDTGPSTGLEFIRRTEHYLAGRGRIASVIGRYYAMDRDFRWNRIARAYATLTGDKARDVTRATTASEVLRAYYTNPAGPSRVGDEFIPPTQIVDPSTSKPIGPIQAGDSVIFFNFRGDRPRQLTKAFTFDNAPWAAIEKGGFDRGQRIDDLFFCTMTGYETGLPVSAIVFEKPSPLPDILGHAVNDAGLTQFRCAETEKFAHVTFFFNDYREAPFPGERRVLLPSPTDVLTYDQQPEMSAEQICAAVLDRLDADDCEPLIVVNFANADMVGHTGKLDAVVRAVEVVDTCVGRLAERTLARKGSLIVTADHGNAEQMWNPTLECPHTAHTTYDVPLFIVGDPFKDCVLRHDGRLADIAPTILHMMGIEIPESMTGRCLLER